MSVVDRIKRFISTAREVGRFKRLLREIGAPPPNTIEAIFNSRQSEALDEFAEWMASREGLTPILASYGFHGPQAKAKLIELYVTLLKGGAGQPVGTTWVPAVPLYDPRLLSLLLEKEDKGSNPLDLAIAALDYVEANAKSRR